MSQRDKPEVRLWQPPSMGDAAVNAGSRPPARQPGDLAAGGGVMTAAALQRLREQARHEGYEEGLKTGQRDGLAQGLAEGRARAEAEQAQWRSQTAALVEAMARPLAAVDADAERALAELAMSVAKQIIRRELRVAQGEIVAVIREAVQLLPMNQQKIRVYLHPEDAALVREAFSLEAGAEHSWQVIDDPGQNRGGCRVLTDDATIDASLDSRIAAVVAHVLGGQRSED